MNGPGSSVEADRVRAGLFAAAAMLFAVVIARMGDGWMGARAPVAFGASVWAALVIVNAWKPGARWMTAVRVLGISVVMLVAASWRSASWVGWAGLALGLVAFDAARSRDEDRVLAPAAVGASICVLWNAMRHDGPPLRVFVFAASAAVLAASVRGLKR